MVRRGLVAVVGMLLMAGLAGCTESTGDNLAQEADPCVVDNPGDFNACEDEPVGVDGTVAHVHDYWGGRDELTVMDTVVATSGTWFGGPIAWAEARPEPESVVPQGTAQVDVTISWAEPELTDGFANPQLWVKRANDAEAMHVADLQNGDTVSMITANENADLPHQVLSSWIFQWVVSVPDDTRPVRYAGDVQFEVHALRGLEIVPYPGHPDRWDNQTDIRLLEESDVQFYRGDGSSDEWACFGGCPEIYRPVDGAIVPFDADRVEATLTMHDDTPFRMGLAFHGALSRDFERPSPRDEDGLVRHYVIPVEAMGDGPYALQSMWEFAVVIEEPESDGLTNQGWDLVITAYRHPV